MKKLTILTLIISLTALNIYASGAGTSAGLTLLEPVSARMSSLARAGVALRGASELMLYNPAGMHNIQSREAGGMFRRGMDEDIYANVLYAKNFDPVTAAVALQYYSTGKIDMYNTSGDKLTEVGQRDVVITVGASKELSGYPVGINLKMISSEVFGEKASGFAADIGAQYPGIMEGLDAGIAVRNLGTSLKYINESDSLPRNIAGGIAYTKNINEGYLNTTFEIPYYLNEQEVLALAGAEYSYCGIADLRLGYKMNLSNSNSEDSTLNMGFGFNWQQYRLDYSVELAGDLDMPYNVSVKAKF